MSPLDTLGRPLRDLRISVTDRCNFRCPYCMPAEIYGERYHFLPKNHVLTFEEITKLARIMVKLGAVKVRLTGGEPLALQWSVPAELFSDKTQYRHLALGPLGPLHPIRGQRKVGDVTLDLGRGHAGIALSKKRVWGPA